MESRRATTIQAVIVLCMMAFCIGVFLAPKILEISTINTCEQRTIDANHNGIADYLEVPSVSAAWSSSSSSTSMMASYASSGFGYCGDGTCQSNENSVNCPVDCGVSSASSTSSGYCGDGICQSNENHIACPQDCP